MRLWVMSSDSTGLWVLAPFHVGWSLLTFGLAPFEMSAPIRSHPMKAPHIVAAIHLTGFVVFAEPALCDWQKVTDENGGSATIDTETIAPGPNGVSANICVDRNSEGKCQTTRVIFNCHGRVFLGLALLGINAPPESLEGKLAAIACAKR